MLRYLIPVLLAGSLSFAENLITNPGFDEYPWNYGWHIYLEGDATYRPDSIRFLSPPRSCWLSVWDCGGMGSTIELRQEFSQAVNCTVSAYFFLDIIGGLTSLTKILLKINGDWRVVWLSKDFGNPTWIRFHMTFDSTQVISGIRFFVDSYGCDVDLWVDDVYVSGNVLEVKEAGKYGGGKIKISPNPFRKNLLLLVEYPDAVREKLPVTAKLYDVTGRLVKSLQIDPLSGCAVWDGTDMKGKETGRGCFIIKLEDSHGKELRGFPLQKAIKF
ncbi:MAG TPA: hypothetical protein ENG67_02275 [candidate division WOR-3 bacterium]|uniref:T9SS type A sorting domain-containing protein n=1 Tax=candidate division WOR-3 bacterium TaxID=2052148 RepID=A0A7C0X918_UNCW3|nr:hypothetical protein [candidate division WOR-3 bacterium]